MSAVLKLVHVLNGKRDYINHLKTSEPKTGVLFMDYITMTLERKAKKLGESSKKNYKTLLFHLENFSNEYEADLYTNSINEDFMDDWVMYLESQNLRLSYINMMVCLVKNMAGKAGKGGYAIDASYDEVEVDKEDPFSVYLTSGEITRIYYWPLLTKKEERIKDLFVVGCLTALRYSDYSTLTPDHFVNDTIVKVTKKTKAKVIIPLHTYVREIYAKYNGEISPGLSIQYFNRKLKVICEKVGLTEPISYNYTKGGVIVYETKPKFQLISSHTARRSAATNMYQTGRMKTNEIMNLTGHTTESSFFRYIRTSKEDKVKQIAGDAYFRK